MARKRMYNTVRTDKFETDIAHYTARKNYDAAAAIEHLANEVGAPIDWTKIDKEIAQLQPTYRHLNHGGSVPDDISECTTCHPKPDDFERALATKLFTD